MSFLSNPGFWTGVVAVVAAVTALVRVIKVHGTVKDISNTVQKHTESVHTIPDHAHTAAGTVLPR